MTSFPNFKLGTAGDEGRRPGSGGVTLELREPVSFFPINIHHELYTSNMPGLWKVLELALRDSHVKDEA
jgi:hypothetical protein